MAGKNLQIGDLLPAKKFMINRELLKDYAEVSGDQNPIHQDEAFAKSVGLENVIAHGMLTMAFGSSYLADWAGDSEVIKEYGARFTKPVVVPLGGEVAVEFSGKVIEVEGSKVKVEIRAECAGQKVLGMAKATLEWE
jgi:acyl dehydratase